MAANKSEEKKAEAKETMAALRGEIATLKAQLSAAEVGKTAAVEQGKASATAEMHGKLLLRYQEGLRDGAALANLHVQYVFNVFGGRPKYTCI